MAMVFGSLGFTTGQTKRNQTMKNKDIITIKTSNKAFVLILYGFFRKNNIPMITKAYANM
ncbi:hypothetical protein GCM10025860_22570 [Methanobacterium ferruginis]|nr:hypothetical protein GCM10025860_22570 [Methanobacterium ferruginis]